MKQCRVSFSRARTDLEALYGAAYLSTQSAYVLLGRRGKMVDVFLWPKARSSARGLARAFHLEYADQRRRWRISRLARSRRLEVLAARIAAADGAPQISQSGGAGLSPQRIEEIRSLLDEGPSRRVDPLGISTSWEELRRKR